jgi:hypothetical protein
LRGVRRSRTLLVVDPAELVSREELAAILLAIHDINRKLSRIIRLLEGDDDGEAWTAEDDA